MQANVRRQKRKRIRKNLEDFCVYYFIRLYGQYDCDNYPVLRGASSRFFKNASFMSALRKLHSQKRDPITHSHNNLYWLNFF